MLWLYSALLRSPIQYLILVKDKERWVSLCVIETSGLKCKRRILSHHVVYAPLVIFSNKTVKLLANILVGRVTYLCCTWTHIVIDKHYQLTPQVLFYTNRVNTRAVYAVLQSYEESFAGKQEIIAIVWRKHPKTSEQDLCFAVLCELCVCVIWKKIFILNVDVIFKKKRVLFFQQQESGVLLAVNHHTIS